MEDRHNNFVSLFVANKENTTLFVHNFFMCYVSLSFFFFLCVVTCPSSHPPLLHIMHYEEDNDNDNCVVVLLKEDDNKPRLLVSCGCYVYIK